MSTPRPGPRQANALSVPLEIECSLLPRRAMSHRRYAYARGESGSVREIRSMAMPSKQPASHLRASLEVPGETSRIRPQAENSPAAMLRHQVPGRSAEPPAHAVQPGTRHRSHRVPKNSRPYATAFAGPAPPFLPRKTRHPRRPYCVGTARFELATPSTPLKCATWLRYVPLPRLLQLVGNVLQESAQP